MSTLWNTEGPYQQWSRFLDAWEHGEAQAAEQAAALPVLTQAALPSDLWERFIRRLTDALDHRLQNWADALVRAVNEAPDEFSAGRALTWSRHGLQAVLALAAHPGLPQSTRESLTTMVRDSVLGYQKTLEDGALRPEVRDRDPGFAERRLRTLRENPLTAVLAPTTPPRARWWPPRPGRLRRPST